MIEGADVAIVGYEGVGGAGFFPVFLEVYIGNPAILLTLRPQIVLITLMVWESLRGR